LNGWIEIAREFPGVAVDLLAQIVEDPDVIAPRQQGIGDV
jgi:hypothetical protein